MAFEVEFSKRLDLFGAEIFAALNDKKVALEAQGKKLYNLSVGTPDFEPMPHIKQALCDAAMVSENWKYSLRDLPELLDTVCAYYKRRFDVDGITPDQIMSFNGSQDGMGHMGLALLNDAVKKGGVMASNHVGGLSGAFIPVSEDDGMIHAAETGCLTIEKLEAMTAVCSVGIDMVIIPGDTTPAVISALIADEAAIGMVNSKTTAVRVIPAIGRKAGEILDFGGLLGYGPIMPVNQHDPSVFINRGGRLPAPMQSLKN